MERSVAKHGGNELAYITKVLKGEEFSPGSGRWNAVLERAFAKKFGVKYAITHNSGTSALHTCLAAAGVGVGDEVISPALTVIMDTFAILYQNAIPVYADVDPETFNIDPQDIERKITPKTKAIITVSYYGLPCDMDPIMEIARKHNLIVIEDNAQCFLGSYKGRLAGTIGHMAIFSFENSKHISSGEGGIVVTNDPQLAERVRKVAYIGYKHLQADEGKVKFDEEEVFQSPEYKRHDTLGWNYRMPEICAAMALAQVERLEDIVARRQEVARMYEEAIQGCDWMIPQKTPAGYTNAYFTYGARYEGEKATGVSWKEFYKKYKELGGDGFYAGWSMPYEEPVMSQGTFYGSGSHYTGPKISCRRGVCPVAEELQPKLMQFKNNYRDLDLAAHKAEALRQTIEWAESRKRASNR